MRIRVHIEQQGPRRIVVSFAEVTNPQEIADTLSTLGDFLAGREHPRGGRFTHVPVDPPAGFDRAVAIIDNQQDIQGSPLFAQLHRAAHQALKKQGARIDSAEPADPDARGPVKDPP